ncbi:uncharacterized protein [Drosophila suzukii]|uniref:Uncharacterized protein isoform X2 n=1 Tax=Drosophila suzukii TaxID=28584 RepID=A0ABM4TZM9_DROSZ
MREQQMKMLAYTNFLDNNYMASVTWWIGMHPRLNSQPRPLYNYRLGRSSSRPQPGFKRKEVQL